MKNKLLFSTKGAEVVSLLILSFSFFFTPLMSSVAPHAPPRPPPAARSLILRGSSPSLHLDLPSSPSLRYRKQVRVCVACPSTASSRAWHKQGSITLSPSLHDAASYILFVFLLFVVSFLLCFLSPHLSSEPFPHCLSLSPSSSPDIPNLLATFLFPPRPSAPLSASLLISPDSVPHALFSLSFLVNSSVLLSIVLLLLVAFPIIGHSCGRGGGLSGRAGGKHPLTCLLECSSTTTQN